MAPRIVEVAGPMSEETIFALALKKPDPAARAAFLAEACGEDAALRRRVERLLRTHEKIGDFLERPAAEQVAGRLERPEATADFTPEEGEGREARGEGRGKNQTLLPSPLPSSVGEFTEASEPRHDVTEDLTGLTSREMPARPAEDPGATIGLSGAQNSELLDSSLGEDATHAGTEDPLAFLAPSQEAGSLGRLDDFEVLEVVGRGGMGVVLKARDTRLQRLDAIKVLAPQLAANGTARRRFAREARAAAAVRDEHVVAIHGVQEDGPVPYLVMEFIAGITLDKRLKEGGPPEVKEVLRIGMQAARGLAAAHAQGLIHRDVKPGNILLESGLDRIKITDFGLARAADDASITQSGVIAGTPLYMSPEQARGEPVDHRSDLFSLGSVLYTLCTGHPAFRASSTIAVMTRVCEDVPRPIRESNPEVPRWLCAVVGKLLAKKPEDRFQSAAEVADLLGQFLAHLQQPDTVAPPPPVAGVGAWTPGRKRKRTLLAVAAAVALVAALGGYLALRPGDSSTPPKGRGGQEPKAWRPRTEEELAALPSPLDGRQREQIPAALLALAGSGDPAAAPAELVAVLGDARFRLPKAGLNAWMAQDREGKFLAIPNADSVAVFDARTGKLVRTLAGTGRMYAVAFSPDGKFLAGGNWLGDNGKDSSITVWNLRTGELTKTIARDDVTWRLAFSPDGKLLLGSGNRGVEVWDLSTARAVRSFPGGASVGSASVPTATRSPTPIQGRKRSRWSTPKPANGSLS